MTPPFLIILFAAVAASFVSCQTEKGATGNAEKREMARRAEAQQQASTDQSQQNLMRAQQNTVNRDGNAGARHGGY